MNKSNWIDDYKDRKSSYGYYLENLKIKDRELFDEYFNLIRDFKIAVDLNPNRLTHTDIMLRDLPRTHPSYGDFEVEENFISHCLGGFSMYNIKSDKLDHSVYISENDLYGEFISYLNRNTTESEGGFGFYKVMLIIGVFIILMILFISYLNQ